MDSSIQENLSISKNKINKFDNASIKESLIYSQTLENKLNSKD